MTWTRTYTDDAIIDAIASSSSWREVLRRLGLTATSGRAIDSVRSHADRLGIDHSHFRSMRRWVESDLRTALASAATWAEAAECLGLHGTAAIANLRGHVARLGLDDSHLTSPQLVFGMKPVPDMAHLARAGTTLAAAWYTLCGMGASWPLEPSRYDLLVDGSDGIRRVQVKTTTTRAGGAWKVYLSSGRDGHRTYDPGEIDDFFIIDADLTYYLIPVEVVGGLQAIHLSAYQSFRVHSCVHGAEDSVRPSGFRS